MNKLSQAAQAKGAVPVGHSSNDLTPFLLQPLETGKDGRGYTSKKVRREMQRSIEATARTFSSLEASSIPAEALEMRARAQKKGGHLHLSNRDGADGFRSGRDFTFTENRGGSFAGTRTASDTPRPRSPDPYSTGEALTSGTRYEMTHQSAYRFTGAPGSTVHAPTQANQVADTQHERHAASATGGFVFRMDTYTASSVWSAKPVGKKWEVQHSAIRRRAVTATGPSSGGSGASSSTSSSSSSSNSGGRGARRTQASSSSSSSSGSGKPRAKL